MINIQLMAANYNFIKPMVLISTDVRNQHLAPIFSEIIVKNMFEKYLLPESHKKKFLSSGLSFLKFFIIKFIPTHIYFL